MGPRALGLVFHSPPFGRGKGRVYDAFRFLILEEASTFESTRASLPEVTNQS